MSERRTTRFRSEADIPSTKVTQESSGSHGPINYIFAKDANSENHLVALLCWNDGIHCLRGAEEHLPLVAALAKVLIIARTAAVRRTRPRAGFNEMVSLTETARANGAPNATVQVPAGYVAEDLSGNPLLHANGMTGQQVQNLLQLPQTPTYGVSFDTLQLIPDLTIPGGRWNTLPTPEPFTSTYPEWGTGGGTQAITNSPITVNKVFPLGGQK
jgi:hypothetical protein